MTTAEIIAIGTELLLGETVDTNTRYIARTLRGLGVNLFRAQTIGDNAGRIAALMREALSRADFVITTGGLGPTVDDPTREAAASAAGLFLEYRPELWEQIKARIAHYGRVPTENQKRQAYLPQFALPIENPVGTAPAFIVEIGEKSIVCLPGVPREMETLLEDAVIPYLQKRYNLNDVIRVRTLHVSGVGEGALDERIGDLETLANPTIGLTAHSGIVSIRIAARAGTTAEAGALIAKIEDDVRSRLGDDIFGADEDTLEAATLRAVAERGWTLACLEFQTEDALQTRLARAAHPAFRGGSRLPVREESLAGVLEKTRVQFNVSSALGVACFNEGDEQIARLALITPHGREERLLDYGGHPGNLPRWAVNMALDWLRRKAVSVEENVK
ncbi:MAG: competence/damage-inducible protein A [Chloroflexi bacterium]|nr:competence/damage-inducible protein A [Chloroflexota bacterium]